MIFKVYKSVNMIFFCKALIEFVAVFVSSTENISCYSDIENSLWFTRENIDAGEFCHIQHYKIPPRTRQCQSKTRLAGMTGKDSTSRHSTGSWLGWNDGHRVIKLSKISLLRIFHESFLWMSNQSTISILTRKVSFLAVLFSFFCGYNEST
jgi:hypothetical protein